MEGNLALKRFGEVLKGIFNYMVDIEFPTFGVDISLWAIYMYGAMAFAFVWFLKKYFGEGD